MSPLGVRSSAWKLASYTVKLNRHHGTVEHFEMLWQKDMHNHAGVYVCMYVCMLRIRGAF
jgi:hypothetical protein